MSALTTLNFRIRPVAGEIGGATQANPSGFSGRSFYYEIVQTGSVLGVVGGFQVNVPPQAQGKVIGVVAYDFFQSRWSVLFTEPDALSPNDNTTYFNNVQAINDFLTAIQNGNLWPQPVTTDAIGQALPYQASLPPIRP